MDFNLIQAVEHAAEYFLPEFIECPCCHEEQHVSEARLGSLGAIEHFRCRYCGVQFSQEGH